MLVIPSLKSIFERLAAGDGITADFSNFPVLFVDANLCSTPSQYGAEAVFPLPEVTERLYNTVKFYSGSDFATTTSGNAFRQLNFEEQQSLDVVNNISKYTRVCTRLENAEPAHIIATFYSIFSNSLWVYLTADYAKIISLCCFVEIFPFFTLQ